MESVRALVDFEIAGNEVWRIVTLFGILFVAFTAGKIGKFLLDRTGATLQGRGRTLSATALGAVARGSVFLALALGVSLGLVSLKLSPKVADLASTVSSILFSVAVGYILYWLVEVPSAWIAGAATRTESKFDDMLVPIIRKSLRVTLVILVLVQIAQILSDKPLTSILAGLGIGGLAFALAAQDSLKNIFGSVIIFIDKPFEMGDRVVIDGHDGGVEEVGLRSTKIRTLEGHLVTVPNGELANKTILNIGKRPFIRRIADITITYDTPPEKIDRALEILKAILDGHEGMKEDFPPRVYFSDFNAASLNLRVIYWYHPPNYWDFMAFSERFNKEVFRRFNEEGIDFAFPTQTVYLAGDEARPLTIGLVGKEDPSASR